MVMSAVSSVRTFGVLVTVMPRACAASTSMFVDAVAEIRDQFQLAVGLIDDVGGDVIGNGRNQHVGGARGFRDLVGRHRRVVEIDPRVEQFAHPGLDRVRKLARHHDEGLFLHRHVLPS
ncbi:hypothetical protein ACVWWK_001777 [Bradyrhizobium sp. LB9.1b]